MVLSQDIHQITPHNIKKQRLNNYEASILLCDYKNDAVLIDTPIVKFTQKNKLSRIFGIISIIHSYNQDLCNKIYLILIF